jgi:hypothetical protein
MNFRNFLFLGSWYSRADAEDDRLVVYERSGFIGSSPEAGAKF